MTNCPLPVRRGCESQPRRPPDHGSHREELALMTVLAHAFGQRYDLPIPLWLFVLGGALVVIASFLLIVPRGASTAVAGDSEHIDAEQEEERAAALDGSSVRGLHPVWGALSVLWLAFL